MQRRIQSLTKTGRGALCHVPLTALAFRRASNQAGSGSPIEDEDPAEVLRKLQEDMRRRAVAEAKEVPPAPPRRSGKTAFFEKSKPLSNGAGATHSESAISDGVSTQAGLEQGGQAQAKNDNAFLKKLSKMESDARLPSFPTYNAAAEERRKKTETRIKAERSKMLVFRDVGMDLDKPILSRDVFLVFKYFRYGKEFAVDNELERMLRYFKEHATNELKIIQDSKLMRGTPSLSRKRRAAPRPKLSSAPPARLSSSVTGAAKSSVSVDEPGRGLAPPPQGLSFQVSSAFPHVRCAITRQFCAADAFSPATVATLAPLLNASSASTVLAPFFAQAGAAEGSGSGVGGKTYNAKDDSLFTVLTPSTFRRPAVVIFSQLGQRFGSQADAEWRRLAYATANPGLGPYMPLPDPAPEAGKGSAAQNAKDGRAARIDALRAMPIDVISLRSADVYKYRWVQRLYVRRFAKSLENKAATEGAGPSVEEMKSALIASSTFVGSQLLEPFYATLGLRNYLLPHVMLVDHEGVVRWLSGGLPDADEKAVFPSLLRQLEVEYLKAAK